MYLGDYELGETINFRFVTTAPDTGAPATLSGTPAIAAYVGNSATQITAGLTLGVDHDSVTGLNLVTAVLTSGNGYADNTDIDFVITTGTVDGNSAVGYVIGRCTIGRAGAYKRLGAPAGASVSADIAAIEAQTDDIGAAGAGLTAIPWNSDWDEQVQSEVADALAVYDPPTNAEMEARTLAAASYATAAALATVDGNVDLVLEDTGTTLPATLSTIAGYIDTEIAAIKAVTDALPDSGALTSIATASALATVDSNVDAIKAKTDSLTFTNTGVVDANITHVISDPVQENGATDTNWGGATA